MRKNSMKKILRNLAKNFGLEVHRLNSATSYSTQIFSACNKVHANIVFDVGANIGQFAQDLRAVGFAGKIISFEPLTSAYPKLVLAAKRDCSWFIHPRTAIGDVNGEIDINISGNLVSSSILPMMPMHSSAALDSVYVSKERTPITRLDSIADQYLSNDSRLFLKIDTQGYEWHVLDGATNTLMLTHCILIEISLVPLYEGQRLWDDVLDRMKSLGFTLWAIQRGFTDPASGRTLQLDVIFLRI